jgi:integrase
MRTCRRSAERTKTLNLAEDFRRKGFPAMSRRKHIPSYRLHKQSGQAIVTLSDGLGNRRDVLLGKHGSPESRQEYGRIIAEWEAGAHRLPQTDGQSELSVNELLLAYWQFAEGYYRKNDAPTKQLHRIKQAIRPVRELYGHTCAADFGPKSLKTVRDNMLRLPCPTCKGTGQLKKPKRLNRRSGNVSETCWRCKGEKVRGWARGLINSSVGCIKRVFKWAVAEELIPPSIFHGLQAVGGLRKGRSEARETVPVRPVEEAHVNATLPLLTPPVKAMVQLQRYSGMRPGEVIIMRPCDIDRSGPTWVYKPESHKTEHHDITRVVFLGPKAQAIMKPFLEDRVPGMYCFSPREAMAGFRERQREARKTPVQPSQQNRGKRKPKKQPRERYSVDTYGNAIERACLKAKVPVWSPNQLRHTLATEVRREAGLDAARAVLGHRSPTVTEVYAEVDATKAAEVMGKLG